jgi:hypothetical protein
MIICSPKAPEEEDGQKEHEEASRAKRRAPEKVAIRERRPVSSL